MATNNDNRVTLWTERYNQGDAAIRQLFEVNPGNGAKARMIYTPNSLPDFKNLLQNNSGFHCHLGVNSPSPENYVFTPFITPGMYFDECENRVSIPDDGTIDLVYKEESYNQNEEVFLPSEVNVLVNGGQKKFRGSHPIPGEMVGRYQNRWRESYFKADNFKAECSGSKPLRHYQFDTSENLKDRFLTNDIAEIVNSITYASVMMGLDFGAPDNHAKFSFVVMLKIELPAGRLNEYNSRVPSTYLYYDNIGTPCPPICN